MGTIANDFETMISQQELSKMLPIPQECMEILHENQTLARNISSRIDPRLTIIISNRIPDLEWAAKLHHQVSDKIFLVQAIHLEISEQHPNQDLLDCRKCMLTATKQNVPLACEFVEAAFAGYFTPFVCWGFTRKPTIANLCTIPVGLLGRPRFSLVEDIESSRAEQRVLKPDDTGTLGWTWSPGNRYTHQVVTKLTAPESLEDGIIKHWNAQVERDIFCPLLVECTSEDDVEKVVDYCNWSESRKKQVAGIILHLENNEFSAIENVITEAYSLLA